MRQPEHGDYSLCIKCAALLRFTEHLELRLATEAEEKELHAIQPLDYENMIRYREQIAILHQLFPELVEVRRVSARP